MNTIETTSEYLDLDKVLFEKIFQVKSTDENKEIELINPVNKEKYPNLFHIVESYIKNMNYLKEIHKKLQESNNLKDYEKGKIETIHNLLFQDSFYLSYIQYVFTKYKDNIANLEELDKQLGKEGYTDLLTYGTLIHCYEKNTINWEQVKEINKDLSIKTELERRFQIEYNMEEEIDYSTLFDEDIEGLKKFFKENDNSQMDLSEKVMYIDKDNSSDYIKQQVRYELMYSLGGELSRQLNGTLNSSGLTDILIDINRKHFNLNTSQVISSIQEECNTLLQAVNSTDSITEKNAYNKELSNLEQTIEEINFSYEQTELIKTKLLVFAEEYISTLLILKENNFQIEEDMKDVFEDLIKKGKSLDKILKNEGVYELGEKLDMIPFLKRKIEKDILMKNIYDNIISKNYILAYNQILQYETTFGKDKTIKLIKQHVNIESIINLKIELLFQKLYNFENPKDILNELKNAIKQLNNLGENDEINQKLSNILIFLEGEIELGKKNLGVDKGNLDKKNSYIKAKFKKWQRIMEKNIKLAIEGDSEAINKLLNLKDFSFKTDKFIGFLNTLEGIRNNKRNIIKTIIKLDKYLKNSTGTFFLKNLVRSYIESKKETLVVEIKELIKGLDNLDITEVLETTKGIVGIEIRKKLEEEGYHQEINLKYLEYILKESKKGNRPSKFQNLYKDLFFSKLTIENILENKEKISNIFNDRNFGLNLQKVYKTLKKINKHEIIVLIVEEYIITQDQKKLEKYLEDLFIS